MSLSRFFTIILLIFGLVMGSFPMISLAIPADPHDTEMCVNSHPTPSEGCPADQQTPDGGAQAPGHKKSGSGVNQEVKSCPSQECKIAGDPMEVNKGYYYDHVSDFSVSVKHGFTLSVDRYYSTSDYSHTDKSSDNHLGFEDGCNWYLGLGESKIEQCLWFERSIYEDGDLLYTPPHPDCYQSGVTGSQAQICDNKSYVLEYHVLRLVEPNGNLVHCRYVQDSLVEFDPSNFEHYSLLTPAQHAAGYLTNQNLWVCEFRPMQSGDSRDYAFSSSGSTINTKKFGMATRQTSADLTIYVLFEYSGQTVPAQTHFSSPNCDLECYPQLPGCSNYTSCYFPDEMTSPTDYEPNLTAMGCPKGYILRYKDGRQYHYQVQYVSIPPAAPDQTGRLVLFDKNYRNNTFDSTNHVDDYLEYTWQIQNTNKRLYEVKAPPSDGRKLVFNLAATIPVVTSVDFMDGSQTHRVVIYGYGPDTDDSMGRLHKVFYPKSGVYGYQYDYGRFNGAATTVEAEVTDSEASVSYLCRISRILHNEDLKPYMGILYHYENLWNVRTMWMHDPNEDRVDASDWRKVFDAAFIVDPLDLSTVEAKVFYGAGGRPDGTDRYDGISIQYNANGFVSSPVDANDMPLVPTYSVVSNYARDTQNFNYDYLSADPSTANTTIMPLTRTLYVGEDSVMDHIPATRLPKKVVQFVGSSNTELSDSGKWVTIKEYVYVDEANNPGINKLEELKTYGNYIEDSQNAGVFIADPDSLQRTHYTYGDTNFPDKVTATTVTDANGDGYQTQVTLDSYGIATCIKVVEVTFNIASQNILSQTDYTYYTANDATAGEYAGMLASVRYRAKPYKENGLDYFKIDKTTTYAYNAKGQTTQITTEDGTSNYTYDGFGNTLTMSTDEYSASYTYSTDSSNQTTYFMPSRLLSMSDSTGQSLTYTYDAYNRVQTVKNALNQTTTYGYDYQGNLKTVAAPGQGTTTYLYNIYGKLLQLTDAEGTITKYSYDEFGRQTEEKVMNGVSPLYTIGYDYGMGSVLTTGCSSCGASQSSQVQHREISNSSGSTKEHLYFDYDFSGRLTGMGTTQDADDVLYDYYTLSDGNPKAVGRVKTITHDSSMWGDQTLSYDYDTEGRLTDEVYPNGRKIEFSYDEFDRLTQLKDPFGFVTNLTYDSELRLSTVDHTTLGTAGFTYNTDDRLTQVALGNGAATAFTYDTHGRMTAFDLSSGGASPVRLVKNEWAYDTLGRKSATSDITVTAPDFTENMIDLTYDSASRLRGEYFKTAPATGATVYGYDLAGNRTSLAVYPITYGAGNRELTYGTPSFHLSYDYKGNVTIRPGHILVGVKTQYTWDAYDRMRTSQYNYTSQTPGPIVSYDYDALGRLLRRTKESDVRLNYWLGLNRLAEEELDSAADCSVAPNFLDTERRLISVGGGESIPSEWGELEDASIATVSFVTDANRGNVTRLAVDPSDTRPGLMIHGDSTAASINNAANSAPWGDTQRRVLSMFVRNQRTDLPVRLTVLANLTVSGATQEYQIRCTHGVTAGTGSVSGACAYWGLDQNVDDGAWHRVEIDLNAVRDAVLAGASIVSVNGLIVEGADVLVDDLTLAAGRLRRAYQLVPGAALGGTLAVQTGADGGEGLTAAHARAYYQYNDLGTVLATTDANGARVGLWRPTFFGEYDDTIDYAQGPTAAAGSPVWPEIGLTGKIWDEDAELYYFNARWYDPHRGRWMSKDPLTYQSSLNLYNFCNNESSNSVDINGKDPITVGIAGILIGAGVLGIGTATVGVSGTACETSRAKFRCGCGPKPSIICYMDLFGYGYMESKTATAAPHTGTNSDPLAGCDCCKYCGYAGNGSGDDGSPCPYCHLHHKPYHD